MEELDKVLKSLKNGKSKDPNNYICELFKEGVVRKDLKLSILMMMNEMKTEVTVPDCLRRANITILHIKKSRIRETPTLSTDADRRTDKNLKRKEIGKGSTKKR